MFPYSSGAFNLYGGDVLYGTEALTDASPAQSFEALITLDEIKGYLKIPESVVDDIRDTLLETFIQAAREQAEIKQGRHIVRKQFDRVYDYWPGSRIELTAPLISVDLVQYRDSSGEAHVLTEGTDYIVDTAKQPGIIIPPYSATFPSFTAWPSSAVLIRFTTGYGSTSAWWKSDAGNRIKNGMLLLVSWWYNNRLPFENATVLSEYPFQVTQCLSYGSRIHVG
jgi:uncharacterized phiE125 gp8 family phage protein